jgi:hypothetical protein
MMAFVGVYLDKSSTKLRSSKEKLPRSIECHSHHWKLVNINKIICRDNEHLMQLPILKFRQLKAYRGQNLYFFRPTNGPSKYRREKKSRQLTCASDLIFIISILISFYFHRINGNIIQQGRLILRP